MGLVHDDNKDTLKFHEQSSEASITTCLGVLVKYSKYSLQEKIDHIEDMENSRKTCLAALYESTDQIQQQSSREIIYMLITQLENKHLEEQLLQLKLESENRAKRLMGHKKEKPTIFTSSKKQPLTNMENKSTVSASLTPSLLDGSTVSGWTNQQVETTAEKIARISGGVNEKQQATTTGDAETATWVSQEQDVSEAEASAQNPVRQKGAPEEPILGETAEKIASSSQGVNEKQQAASTGDAKAAAMISKAEAS